MKLQEDFDFNTDSVDYFNDIVKYFDLNLDSTWIDDFSYKLYRWSSVHVPKLNVISIFSGAGGLDIGFRDAGFNILSHLELEEDFCKTLELNSSYYNNAKVINIDIRDFHPKEVTQCDLIIGGPPCQTFSAAGRRAAGVQGIDDNRGTLFEEYIRLLKFYSPKCFLFENVYGITGAQSGKAWEMIKDEFSKAGYKIYFRVLNTADYGVPQFRERMIIVGIKDGEYKFPRPTHGPDSSKRREYYSARQAILNTPVKEDVNKLIVNGRHGYLLNAIPPGLNYSFYTEKLGHPEPLFAWRSKFSDYLYKADPEKPVRTIKAQGGQYTGPLHWENRYFSVNEYMRLQTFPDIYKIFGNRQRAIHQIGNSVPPQFSRVLALSILDQVFDISLPIKIDYLDECEQLSFRKRKRELTSEYLEAAKNANFGKAVIEKIVKDQDFKIQVSSTFKVKINYHEGYNVKIISNNRILSIILNNPEEKAIQYSIDIKQAGQKKWPLPYDKVIIESTYSDVWSYLAAWKSLEYVIKTNKIMDDLVQLNGYYQYIPAIDIELSYINKKLLEDKQWCILMSIINIKPIRKIMSYEDISKSLNISLSEVSEMANFLKEVGYEIRNHNTNPQIEEGNILIPYLFPTLSNLSVQLRKTL